MAYDPRPESSVMDAQEWRTPDINAYSETVVFAPPRQALQVRFHAMVRIVYITLLLSRGNEIRKVDGSLITSNQIYLGILAFKQ